MKQFPISPADFRADDPLNDWRKFIAAKTIATIKGRTIDSVAAEMFGKAVAVEVMKAAVDPISTTSAPTLAVNRLGSFLRSIQPQSAAAQLFQRVARYNLLGTNTITLPKLASDFPAPAWVAESGAIPVFRGTFAANTLGPAKKLAALAGVSHELQSLSAENAVQIVTEAMEDAAAKALDASLFASTAATATQPAGLLNGVTASSGTAGGGQAALVGDLKAIAGGMADAGFGGNFILFANPRQAVSISVLANGPQTFELIQAPFLPAGTLVGVHPAGLATGFGLEPDVDVSENALIHYDDASPLAIATAGSPNTIAAPVRSAFQTATHVIRLIMDAAWTVRKAGAVQAVTGATF